MLPPTPLRTLALLLTTLPLFATALDRCPSTENTYVTSKGFLYTVCPATDYITTTVELIRSVNTVTDCVLRCDERGGCVKAIYEPGAKLCHIKQNGGAAESFPWVASDKFDAIRLNNPVPEGADTDRCPFDEQRVSAGGKSFNVCPGTDFRVEDTRYYADVGSVAACASICASTNGCSRAVFENTLKRCHVKPASNARTIWTMGKNFDAIRLA